MYRRISAYDARKREYGIIKYIKYYRVYGKLDQLDHKRTVEPCSAGESADEGEDHHHEQEGNDKKQKTVERIGKEERISRQRQLVLKVVARFRMSISPCVYG